MESYPKLADAVSSILKKLRKDAGLSQRKLSMLSSVDRVYILQIERGKYRLTLNVIFFLADALNVPAGKFVEMIDQERKRLTKLAEEGDVEAPE